MARRPPNRRPRRAPITTAPPIRAGPYSVPPVPSAGPVKGSQVSLYMDGQENELRARLHGQNAVVARRGDGIVVVIFDNALFAGGTDLSGNGVGLLRAMAPVLRHYDHTALQIAGYTDTTGAVDQNNEVSDRRAKAVAAALASDGVGGNRMSAQGYGATNPRVKTGDNVNEPRNRRIEIRITATPVG